MDDRVAGISAISKRVGEKKQLRCDYKVITVSLDTPLKRALDECFLIKIQDGNKHTSTKTYNDLSLFSDLLIESVVVEIVK